ncbi:hypothetical protein [Microbulbifer elongatus]|uniref:hypothetical protein n=1 Tax=Microbulbifer elongatus TaxID=86173 RepID=UPI001CFDD7A8|nr:hypothetical protein [Microbulbifer elongatus]
MYIEWHEKVCDKIDRARKVAKERWGWSGGYWYPLVLDPKPNVLVLALDSQKLKKKYSEKKLGVFFSRFFSGQRMYVFDQCGPDMEELEYSVFSYDFWETITCDCHLQNLIYCSHEGTITLGGKKLVSEFKGFCSAYSEFLVGWA